MDSLDGMRRYIKDYYDNAPGWVAKVDKMHEQQIIAVYLRFKQGPPPKTQRRSKPASPRPFAHYICRSCNAAYKRDNPELKECEYCGSMNIEVYREYR